jgi:hypothetical protein
VGYLFGVFLFTTPWHLTPGPAHFALGLRQQSDYLWF